MIVVLLSLIGVAAGQYCGSTTKCGHYGPAVCGSDGRTYINTCYLNIAICHAKQQHRYLRLSHSGACKPTVHTPTHSRCDEICDEEGSTADKVCMSNGITYESRCEALNAACNATHNHEHLTVVHSGECLDLHSSCSSVIAQPCSKENKHYMCASNGYTYQNECYLKEAQCRLQSASSGDTIDVLHDGLCHDTSTNGSRNVDCSKYADMSYAGAAIEGVGVIMNHCPRPSITTGSLGGSAVSISTADAVCADGHTYYNECYFCSRMAHSHKINYQQMNIPISHEGACKKITVVG